MIEPMLTISIPTYNGEKTIANMLDLLLPQVNEEVEVLISDNASTDGTLEVLNRYKEEYPFIRIEHNAENYGADYNFLQCLKKANGKFVMLLSDDDIIVEGAVEKIVFFLKKHPNISVAFMESVGFKDRYINVSSCHEYQKQKKVTSDIITTDKKEFYMYCTRLFGFTSSHVWSTKRIREISNPEEYFGTFFLQAYMVILCSNRDDDQLGIISGPCIAIGEYGLIGNFDMALVEGVYYKSMMDVAVKNGYPVKLMRRYYQWKIYFLLRNNLIKEKAIGEKMTSIENIFKATRGYPISLIRLIPYLILPKIICRKILLIVRKKQGRDFASMINRPT